MFVYNKGFAEMWIVQSNFYALQNFTLSNKTTLHYSILYAHHYTVFTLSRMLGFAQLARSSSTTSRWPLKLATCSAVKPSCRVDGFGSSLLFCPIHVYNWHNVMLLVVVMYAWSTSAMPLLSCACTDKSSVWSVLCLVLYHHSAW